MRDLNKLKALKQHLNLKTLDEAEECMNDYSVYTNSEADEACDEALDSYIKEYVMPEIPEAYRYYFEAEAFKRDILMNDGRGHILSYYDSEEHEMKVDEDYYCIYRTN